MPVSLAIADVETQEKKKTKMAHFQSTVNLCAGGFPTVMLYQKFDGGHATRKQNTHTRTWNEF